MDRQTTHVRGSEEISGHSAIGRQHGRGPEEESGPHGRVRAPYRKKEDVYISLHPGSLIPPTGGRKGVKRMYGT